MLMMVVHDPLQVVRAGGVTPILQPSQQHKSLTASDSSAISDALECLLQVGAASSEGKAIAVESGCLRATAQALQVAVMSCACLQLPDLQLVPCKLFEPLPRRLGFISACQTHFQLPFFGLQ